MGKERIDVLLFNQGLASSREEAKRLIMAGLVYHGTEKVDKPGTKITTDAKLTVKGALHPYVSRGGLKLAKAIDAFSLSFEDKIVLDVGASTGGFTDCALQHGARFVYSLDVGYGQLAWSLRTDQRVKVIERTNFRYADPDWFDPRPQIAVMDVSFISITKLFAKLKEILIPEAMVVTLVKPQFEAGVEAVAKGGIVRDKAIHLQVIQDVVQKARDVGWQANGITFSPIRGGDGNIEFLLWLTSQDGTSFPQISQKDITDVVELAHQLAQ